MTDEAILYLENGVQWEQAGRLAEALERYQYASHLQPNLREAWFNAGNILKGQGKLEEAAAAYRRAVEVSPGYLDAYNNLGVTLAEMGRWAEAAEQHERALVVAPDYVEALVNLGIIYMYEGRLEESAPYLERALRLQPDHENGRRNRGLLHLLEGNLALGWPEYQRHCWTRGDRRPFLAPYWNGCELNGQRILLQAGFGQGLGDIIQFLRYAPLVKARGGTVMVECPRALFSLAATCAGIDELIGDNERYPPFDQQIVMLSLPPLFSFRMEDVPARVPYLFPDKSLVERWRAELASDPGFKIGIVWQGNPANEVGLGRSAPLAKFAPLAKLPGVSLYSLQAGIGTEQLTEIDFPVIDLGSRTTPLDNLAALVINMDLVVSVDTAPAHLAGALAVPLWILLAKVPDWRWLLKCSHTAWYPTARLFRQKEAGNWHTVFAEMAAELPQLLARR